MDGKIFLAGAVVAVAAAGGWWALTQQPPGERVTPERAAALQAQFDALLGKAAPMLRVTAASDHYALHLDAAPVLPRTIGGRPATITLSPLDASLTPEGAGIWQVTAAPQQVTLGLHVAASKPQERIDVDYVFEGMEYSGHYSEALRFFSDFETKVAATRVRQLQPLAAGAMLESVTQQGPIRAQGQAVQGPTGLDLSGTTTLGRTETVNTLLSATAGTPSAPKKPSRVQIAESRSESRLTGLRWPQLLALLQAAQALPPEAGPLPAAEKAALLARVRAALPVFDGLSGNAALSGITAETPPGPVTITRLGVEIETTGVLADARLREAITAEGLKLPPGLLPQWAEPLLPQQLRLDLSFAGFDLAAAAEVLLDDLARPEMLPVGPQTRNRLAAAILPKGAMTVRLEPSHLTGPGYRLEASGQIEALPGGKGLRSASADLRLAGLDKILTALQDAPEKLRQAGMGLMMARGFAKVEPDGALSWALRQAPDGAMTVNGTMLGGKMGMQP